MPALEQNSRLKVAESDQKKNNNNKQTKNLWIKKWFKRA